MQSASAPAVGTLVVITGNIDDIWVAYGKTIERTMPETGVVLGVTNSALESAG